MILNADLVKIKRGIKVKCNRCKEEITHEVHASGYDSDGPAPPFYCSEGCYANKGLLYKLYWKVVKYLKQKLECYG